MPKMSIWRTITIVLVLKGLDGIECADSMSTTKFLSVFDPVTQTKDQLEKLLPSFIQEKVNRDNQTTRFIELRDALENLNRCNKTNRQEVSDMIATVLIKELELLGFEAYDLFRSSYLIAVAILSVGELKFLTPPCAYTGNQDGKH